MFHNAADVIRMKGENVYSVYFLTDGREMIVSLTLKDSEAMLTKFGFFRVHKSFIVNLKYVVRYIKGEGGFVVMTDGSEVEVSRRNNQIF